MTKSLEERIKILEDQQEILKLKARYVNINDGGWKGPTHTDPQAVAELFTEDGVWDGLPSSPYAAGREEIRKLFEAFGAVPFVVHYVTNPVIEVDGDSATGHWHALVTITVPGDKALWTLGYYIDEYVRTAEGWKFKKLRFETAATAPYELGWAAQRLAYTEDPFKDSSF
jgi:uncharacterized protein (TIGR02246 family)